MSYQLQTETRTKCHFADDICAFIVRTVIFYSNSHRDGSSLAHILICGNKQNYALINYQKHSLHWYIFSFISPAVTSASYIFCFYESRLDSFQYILMGLWCPISPIARGQFNWTQRWIILYRLPDISKAISLFSFKVMTISVFWLC